MKKNLVKVILCFLSLALIYSCSSWDQRSKELKEWMTPNGKLKVLSSTAMINDMVKRIVGDKADTMTLIQGNLDPHSYQLVKGDDEKLSFATLIFVNGLGLEHGASLQHVLEQKANAVSIGNNIQLRYPERILHVDGQVDPHIWMDMSLFAEAIPVIVTELSIKDPKNQAEYRKRGGALRDELLQLHTSVRNQMHAIPSDKRYLVTSHDAFNYYARAYLADENELSEESWRERFQAPEGLAPDSQLSSSDIQNIIDHLKKYQIHVIFPESNVSQDSIKKIVQAGKESGVDVVIASDPLYGDAMGPPGSEGDSYPKMILHDASVINKYLNGGK